jgi:hypothetical protein
MQVSRRYSLRHYFAVVLFALVPWFPRQTFSQQFTTSPTPPTAEAPVNRASTDVVAPQGTMLPATATVVPYSGVLPDAPARERGRWDLREALSLLRNLWWLAYTVVIGFLAWLWRWLNWPKPSFIAIRAVFNRLRLRLGERPFWDVRSPSLHQARGGVVRYGVAIFQDTILPVFFDYIHRKVLERYGRHVEFVQMEWGECIERFEAQDIDVALHNLSSVVPYFANESAIGKEPQRLPSIFVPFFDFCGQGIFIRRHLIDRLDTIPTLNRYKQLLLATPNSLFDGSINSDDRKLLLKTLLQHTQPIVAIGTDMEVALNNLYDLADFDPNAQPPLYERPKGAHAEKGYEMFIDPNERLDVYCGGLIQLFKLQRLNDPTKVQAIQLCTGKHLNVRSANGLVTTNKFAIENPRVIRDLTRTWFWSIKQFRKDVLACVDANARLCDTQRLRSMVAFLDEMLKTSEVAQRSQYPIDLQMSIELLQLMFGEGYEDFYDDWKEAFRKFYGKHAKSELKALVPVAQDAAMRKVTGSMRANVADSTADQIVERMIKYHRQLFPKILPEAC